MKVVLLHSIIELWFMTYMVFYEYQKKKIEIYSKYS